MAVPKIILDGTQAYGTRTLTIGGVAYKVNNISVTRPSTEAEDENTDGTPNRRRETRGRATLTGELQLATSSTAYPKFGDTFSATFDAQYGSETFVLKPVPYGETNAAGDIRVVAIEATEVINSITVVN